MEDDDEFGDLYTDVLRPLQTTVPSPPGGVIAPAQSLSRIDFKTNSRDEDAFLGASGFKNLLADSNSSLGIKLNAPIGDKTQTESGSLPGTKVFNLDSNLGIGGRVLKKGEGVKLTGKDPDFMDDEDDLDIVLDERDKEDDGMVDKPDVPNSVENIVHSLNQTTAGEINVEQMIPGISGKSENLGASNLEDGWESDESADDLQIVLNENDGQMGMERMTGVVDKEDEDGEPLVIVAGNVDTGHHQQLTMDKQEWGGEEAVAGADGEKKEFSDATKGSGGGMVAPATMQPKVGYSNHVYHQPFHSQFKYVRPGAPPTIPGAAPAPPGGIQGQVRPLITMGSVAGRGRGDWRPGGKGFHPGYGTSMWGANAAGHGYGSGLDFTLPSHKTVFEVDIDGFEEKPWKLPGIDVSDFFNFGLNEDSWKDYCKQLEHLRLETTMQSKIRVYESGRAEKDYDPDLPPELAAAVGIQDISSGNPNPDLNDFSRASAHGRAAIPIGRPIPVEIGSGDRIPSVETRRQRMHDSDAIIEIVCHSTVEDDDHDMEDKPDIDSAGEEDLEGGDGMDNDQLDEAEHAGHFPHAYSGRKKELVARRELPKTTVSGGRGSGRENDLHAASEPLHESDEEVGVPHLERSSKGRELAKSPKMKAGGNDKEQIVDDQNESFASEDGSKTPPLSSSRAVGSDEDRAVAVGSDANEESVKDDGSFVSERDEMAVDATTSVGLEEGKTTYGTNKGEISSRVEPPSQGNDDGEVFMRSSENSKARSGTSKDQRKFPDSFEDEVLPDKLPPRRSNTRRPAGEEDNVRRKGHHEREETGRPYMERGREDSRLRRGEDPNTSQPPHMKSESSDRRKESDVSDGSWRRRDENFHGRKTRVEDTRKKEHGGEIGSRNRGKVRESERCEKDERYQIRNQLDADSWRESNQDQDRVSRQRNKDDNRRTRNERADDLYNRRKKEGAPVSRDHSEKEDVAYNNREHSNHRKRERDDSSDLRKRDDHTKLKDDVHYSRQNREGSIQKERGERQRDRDEYRTKQHEEILSRREREETRSVMRIARIEDKTWTGHSRGKDEYEVSGREYPPRDMGRHNGQLKRKDRGENENFSQRRGQEDYTSGNQVSDDEKRARYGRSSMNNERVVYASDTSRLNEHRQKEGSRKSKESESGEGRSLMLAKRNQDEQSGQICETVNLRGRTEGNSVENDTNANPQSDEEQISLRKGRSKLERWTSNKDRDFSTTSVSPSSLKMSNDLDTHNNIGVSVSKLPEEPSRKVGDASKPLVDVNTGAEMNNANGKVVDDNKHLDTVAKLKKRSERFKLPMPSEKDVIPVKKMEGEPLPPAQTENPPDSEIKLERPARKRRWTGN